MKRYVIESTLLIALGQENAYPLFWNFTAWSANEPYRLMDRADAERELLRLQKSLPHDHTLCIVDFIELRETCARWKAVLNAELDVNGYAAMTRDERATEPGKALRRAAVALANDAHPMRRWVPAPRQAI